MAFFSLLAGLAYVFDAVIASGLRAVSTSKFGSMNRVMAGDVNAAIVINGSSRALTQYDPRIITETTGRSAYNLGMNAIHIDLQLAILKAYLAHNRPPEIVIQNLDAFSFEATAAGEIHDPGVYLPYLRDPGFYASLRAIDPVVWKWRHIPLYGYAVDDLRFTWINGLLGHLGVSGREDYFQGFNPQFLEWTGDFERFRAAQTLGVSNAIEPAGVRALTELIMLCRERGIRLFMVYSPEYFEMQTLQRNRKEIFGRFEALSSEFGVPLWDFSLSPLSTDKANFYNSEHLNATGAAIFSREIGEKLVALGFALPASSAMERGRPRDGVDTTPKL